MEDSERRMERAKHLFLSHLQARVGSSLVSRLGHLSPEAIFETPYSELVGWTGNSEKAARAFDQLQSALSRVVLAQRRLVEGSPSVLRARYA